MSSDLNHEQIFNQQAAARERLEQRSEGQRLAQTRLAMLCVLAAGVAPFGLGLGRIKAGRRSGDCEVCGKQNVRAARKGVFRCAQHLNVVVVVESDAGEEVTSDVPQFLTT